jgi:hypothetical protein
MATLLIFPKKKWKTQDKRVKSFEEYISRKDRLGKVYGDFQIDTVNIDLPSLTVNDQEVYNEWEIKKITEPYRKDYSFIGVVFPYSAGKYAGNYYPNTDPSDHKLDFYLMAGERTKHKRRGQNVYDFEEFLEHEISHGVALDIGLKGQSVDLGFLGGGDNTHWYFYHSEDLLDKWYAELRKQHEERSKIYQGIINEAGDIVDKLEKRIK